MQASPRRLRILLTGLALLGLPLLAAACRTPEPPGAVGPSNEISVFHNVPRDGRAMALLTEVFEAEVYVVSREPAFLLDPVPFQRFDVHREVKNQIFLVDMSRDDALTRAVPGMIGVTGRDRMRDRRPFRLLVRDRFARGQTTLFVLGWSEEDVVTALSEVEPERILREYESAVIDGLVVTMFSLGEEVDLPRQVAEDYGWTVRLPSGFFGAADPENRFVKFNAESPVRLFLVHWTEDPLPLERESWDPVLAWMLRVFNDGDFVEEEDTRVFPDTFQSRPCVRWEGIWQNEKYTIGGPFRALAFHDGGRGFLIAMQVFAPGSDKLPALRQLEAVARTFRTVR